MRPVQCGGSLLAASFTPKAQRWGFVELEILQVKYHHHGVCGNQTAVSEYLPGETLKGRGPQVLIQSLGLSCTLRNLSAVPTETTHPTGPHHDSGLTFTSGVLVLSGFYCLEEPANVFFPASCPALA